MDLFLKQKKKKTLNGEKLSFFKLMKLKVEEFKKLEEGVVGAN